MSGFVAFDTNGIELRWKYMGLENYGIRIKVTDEYCGDESMQYIDDKKTLRELIEALIGLEGLLCESVTQS